MKLEVSENVLLRVSGDSDHSIWMLHGFADSGLSFHPLFATSLATQFTLWAPDLPGFGNSARRGEVASIVGMAESVVEVIAKRAPAGSIALVGHSLGGPIAVEVASRLAGRVRAVVSLEGNLTEADAYFSGTAADYDTPEAFKQAFVERIWQMAGDDLALRRYFGSVILADAEVMWRLGRDAKRASLCDAFGHAYRALKCPTLYVWSPASTPAPTASYLEEHQLENVRVTRGGHWPMIDIPEQTAALIGDFARKHLGC